MLCKSSSSTALQCHVSRSAARLVSPFVALSLSLCLPLCLPLCLSLCLSLSQSVCLSACHSVIHSVNNCGTHLPPPPSAAAAAASRFARPRPEKTHPQLVADLRSPLGSLSPSLLPPLLLTPTLRKSAAHVRIMFAFASRRVFMLSL